VLIVFESPAYVNGSVAAARFYVPSKESAQPAVNDEKTFDGFPAERSQLPKVPKYRHHLGLGKAREPISDRF
jgi:hypothetical protein